MPPVQGMPGCPVDLAARSGGIGGARLPRVQGCRNRAPIGTDSTAQGAPVQLPCRGENRCQSSQLLRVPPVADSGNPTRTRVRTNGRSTPRARARGRDGWICSEPPPPKIFSTPHAAREYVAEGISRARRRVSECCSDPSRPKIFGASDPQKTPVSGGFLLGVASGSYTSTPPGAMQSEGVRVSHLPHTCR